MNDGSNALPVSRFDRVLGQFNEMVLKLNQPGLTPVDAMNQFHVWMGAVQQVLHQANQEVNSHLPALRAQGGDTLEVLKEFGEYQSGLAASLDEISQTLRGCTSVQAFQEAQVSLMQSLQKMEALGHNLDTFLDGEEDPGPGPLPDSVRECLDCLEQGLQYLVRYAEVREHEDLLRLSQQLDQARQALDSFLAEHG